MSAGRPASVPRVGVSDSPPAWSSAAPSDGRRRSAWPRLEAAACGGIAAGIRRAEIVSSKKTSFFPMQVIL